MHVLMISLDSRLATQPDSNSVRRHIEYADHAGKLTIVAYTKPGSGGPRQHSENLTVIPTNSISRFTFVADALRLASRVIADEKPDLITTQDPFAAGLVGWIARNQAQVPVLVQNHCYFIDNEAWLAENPLRNYPFNALGKFVSSRADMYRTVNEHERDTFLSRGGSAERVFTYPLGTASDAFINPPLESDLDAAREKLGIEPHHKVIIWAGFPVAFKRVPLLLDVFRRVVELEPDARLLLVGDMSGSKDDIPAIMDRLGIREQVIAPGFVPHAELPAYYGLADVYLMTSSYEGIPRVLMEASAAALPLVAFDRVGVREVVNDGENGYLLPEGDCDGMAQRVVELLHDEEKAQQFGQNARRISVERFSATKNAENVIATWEQAIALGLKS
ncbi:MAG: glycosyltransferase family 4 protein [Chloroflexota bacterium]